MRLRVTFAGLICVLAASFAVSAGPQAQAPRNLPMARRRA